MINRIIEKNIHQRLHKGKVILLLGARQVGKTTLVKKIINQYHNQALYLSGDEIDIRRMLSNASSTQLKSVLGKNRLVIIDEA